MRYRSGMYLFRVGQKDVNKSLVTRLGILWILFACDDWRFVSNTLFVR